MRALLALVWQLQPWAVLKPPQLPLALSLQLLLLLPLPAAEQSQVQLAWKVEAATRAPPHLYQKSPTGLFFLYKARQLVCCFNSKEANESSYQSQSL